MNPSESSEKVCRECGSKQVIAAIRVSIQANAGGVGLPYQAMPFPGTEQLLADVCDECGTVQRLFVKYAGREWVK